MAQRQYDFAAQVLEPVNYRIRFEQPEDDSVTSEGMAKVRQRAAASVAGRTLHSLSEPGKIVKVG